MKLHLVIPLLFLAACSSGPKRSVNGDDRRLLADYDQMQGWAVPKKVAPVVGQFDVIYDGKGIASSQDNCTYADGPDSSVMICDKGAVRTVPRGRRSVGPTQAM